MSQTHFKHPSRHLAPIHTTSVARRSEDNSILSSTTSIIVFDVDLNLDGQEFAASRREQRDPSRPRRRAAAHTTTFSTASTSGTQYGNMQQMLRQRAAGGTVARTAHGTRSAHGARSARRRLLERRGRRAHDARHALGACHVRDGRGASRRINAAAPRGPPPRGPPPLGAASRLRHSAI
jgi:hypothetical protein